MTDGFSVDPEGSSYHPMHRAAFGPIYASGCPTNGSCGCGRATDLVEEFNCQLDQLSSHDIPITAYLFDGSAWSRAGSNARNACTGPDCCEWNLGDQPVERLARLGVRGVLHFWGGCHDDEQYRRASTRLGGNLLGFYLDDGSSDAELMGVAEFMEGATPGDWENFAGGFRTARRPHDQGLARAGRTGNRTSATCGRVRRPEGGGDACWRLAPTVAAPMAELTGYDNETDAIPDEEVYYATAALRRAAARDGAHALRRTATPGAAEYGPGLVKAYRFWAWFHKRLVPYFYSLRPTGCTRTHAAGAAAGTRCRTRF